MLKKIDLERLKAASLENRLRQAMPPEPFTVKLDGELVKKLRAMAQERQVPLDAVVAELLERSLEK